MNSNRISQLLIILRVCGYISLKRYASYIRIYIFPFLSYDSSYSPHVTPFSISIPAIPAFIIILLSFICFLFTLAIFTLRVCMRVPRFDTRRHPQILRFQIEFDNIL